MSESGPNPPAQNASEAPPCPICGAKADPAAAVFPFCSARCRLVDLGRWFDGRYVVSREATPADFEDAPPAPPEQP